MLTGAACRDWSFADIDSRRYQVTLAGGAPLIVFAPYFVCSARREEELMREQFPEQYPQYMRRTKMIVPFVL